MATTEQDLKNNLMLLMGRDYATHDRTRKIRVAWLEIKDFIAWLEGEILKDERKTTPKNKNGFYEMWADYVVLLDWGLVSRDRVVIDTCARLGVIIPPDPEIPSGIDD